MEKTIIEKLLVISKENLLFDTFEEMNRDSLDFNEVSKWCVKKALLEAYELGKLDKENELKLKK